MRKTVALSLLSICIHVLCYGQSVYEYKQPKKLDDGWTTNTLSSQNVDSILVYKFFNQLKQHKHKLHSVLLVKNNQLILEEYFYKQTVNTPHDLRSTTKSIRSLLLGIAIDKGFIKSIHDPISKYLKNNLPQKNIDPRKEKITIENLLTMSSGLDCNDWDKKSKGQEDKVYRKKDWLQYTLNLPMVNAPGEVANYCSMGAILIAEIIAQASGLPINEFANKYLFKPLAIYNLYWGHTSSKEVISSAKRLYMIPRDLAKIGQLLINKGYFNGKQVVSEKWIKTSTTPKTKITGIDYGYFWWNIPFKVNEKTIISKTATGNGGQYIMVIPEMNIVAIFTGSAYNSSEDKLPFAIMKDVFLSAINDKE